ncbi:hypothetical protein [Nonomuraea sp. NPDC050202]|uniref:hypothetical protein n=1 Tax=Nonomuraea sp. NPDC050202 TaxID=3155035 RepID=UPI00340ED717
MTCLECGLPLHRGFGDGFGSCNCPRCPGCRNIRGECDCYWNDPDQFDLDDDGWNGAEVAR